MLYSDLPRALFGRLSPGSLLVNLGCMHFLYPPVAVPRRFYAGTMHITRTLKKLMNNANKHIRACHTDVGCLCQVAVNSSWSGRTRALGRKLVLILKTWRLPRPKGGKRLFVEICITSLSVTTGVKSKCNRSILHHTLH